MTKSDAKAWFIQGYGANNHGKIMSSYDAMDSFEKAWAVHEKANLPSPGRPAGHFYSCECTACKEYYV